MMSPTRRKSRRRATATLGPIPRQAASRLCIDAQPLWHFLSRTAHGLSHRPWARRGDYSETHAQGARRGFCQLAARGCNRQTPPPRKLIWIGNFIALWTNWSVYRGSAEEKTCPLLSTSIWEEGDNLFAEQSQEVLCFQSTCNRGSAVILPRAVGKSL